MGLTYPENPGVGPPYSPLERDVLRARSLARQEQGRDPRQNEVVAHMRERWRHLGPVVLERLVFRGRLVKTGDLMPRYVDALARGGEVSA